MTFASGSLVRARSREWVVLPGSEDDFLLLRPLGGTQEEVAGLLTELEPVEPAQFPLPDPSQVGDYRSGRLLRDALRLSLRSSAGPFRSFGEIAVEPRPYQLVPLMMGLRLDTVRLLIADDVGIGKTVEACLVAKELLAQGSARRLAVLCPPHLAEQWQTEMRNKFHIDAEVVLPSTATRLERGLQLGQSLFDVYPNVVVSIDFIKSDKRKHEFVRTCPELVIVDEAHGCAFGMDRGHHQRHDLVRSISADTERHLILVTATPHSGKEAAFRSLLEFLDPSFAQLPEDLGGPGNEPHRRRLARHFVQRRRADIRGYLGAETAFPERQEREETYTLSKEYKRLFRRVLEYARETVRDPAGGQHRQRVRWWSALALLRSLASSPAAAAATLRSRAAAADTDTAEQADEIGRRTVLDQTDDEAVEAPDAVPGSDYEPQDDEEARLRRRLREMAREADALQGDKDAKLVKAATLIKQLVEEGYRPVVFCRFIPTAEYVAEQLRSRLGKSVEVTAVTGVLPPAERQERVLQLAKSGKRVLVATDCLSEGINLQEDFDAVAHYDLSWNPTRHEQREGRVDRFGQPKSTVRTLTYFGTDNEIDPIVLRVLYEKHRRIRTALGISVPVPAATTALIEAIAEGLLLGGQAADTGEQLRMFEEFLQPKTEELYGEWDAAADREKRSRTMFAQETLKPEEVARELEEVRAAIGTATDVAGFFDRALREHGAVVKGQDPLDVDPREVPRALKDLMGVEQPFHARFELPVQEDQFYLTRASPVVEGLASYVVDTALDPLAKGVASRCGAIRTDAVTRRTTLLLVRFRFDILQQRRGGDNEPLLAEESRLIAFVGAPASAEWLDDEAAEQLLTAQPTDNILPEQATEFVGTVIEGFEALWSHIEEKAAARGQALLESHRRVRTAAGATRVSIRVEPKLPADVLGVYVILPAPGRAS